MKTLNPRVWILPGFYALISGLLFLFSNPLQAQQDIFQIMERTDLSMNEIEKLADTYFQSAGKGQGSGYKQYQRWLYERKFHLDENGFYISQNQEDKAYYDALKNMNVKSRSSHSWSELGPQTWTYTSGWNPGVGRITSVAVHPSDTTVIYVSSPGGGIWKSTNSGNSWTPLIDFMNSAWMNVFHLMIDPNNQNVIYACLSSGGVLKSTNAGTSWSSTGSGPSNSRQVKVHPTNSSIVFCAATNGIWRSTNGGTSWTQVETAHKEDIEFNPLNPNTMYASGSSGTSCVWRSTNNGVSWTAIGSGSGITHTGRTLIAVSPADPAVVYAVQANGSIFGRMYRSADSGATYTTTVVGNPSSGTNYFGYETSGTGTTGQATYDMAICVNPLNANEVHIAGIICWKTINGGTSFFPETAWSYPNSTGYNHADVHALEWVNGTIYSGSDGGIYKSINAGNDWIDKSAGLGIRQFYRIACSKTDGNVITTGAQDNGSSFRRSNGSWVDWLGADGMDNVISPTNAAIAIGTSQYGAIYKTTNSGGSRSNLSQPASGNWITPIVMHPTTHDTVYGGWTGVWRSGNGGVNWTNISSGSINVTLDALAVAPSNTRYIYTSKGSTLYRTSNGGGTWTSIIAPASITSIFVSKNDPEKIWISCNSSTNRVYVSTDAGSNFTNLSNGLPSLSARSVVVDEDALGTVYVGMNIGVYYRDSVNNTWNVHATGLPLVAINEVEIQKATNKLRVATYGRGVWESSLQNVNIACTNPAGIGSSSITSNSATVSWNSVSGAVGYTVDYKKSSDTGWINAVTSTSSTSHVLTSLSALTTYDWRVKTVCGSGSSVYSQSGFTTLSVCGDPTGLLVNSTTTSGATLGWNAVSGAIDYSVDYKPSSSGSWTSTTSGTNSISLSSLSAGRYDWRVKANCSAGSGSFVSSDFIIYCGAAGSSTAAGYIDRVSVANLSRISNSDGGYYDATNLYASLKPGNSYTMTVSPAYSGAKKNTYWSVFIDYNRDGDFTDAGELAGQKTYKGTGNTTISFTVPTGASLGDARMRVMMSLSAYPTSCSTFSSGEVEDFTAQLTNTPEEVPFNLLPVEVAGGLIIYPNPASGELYIHYDLDSDVDRTEIKVLDLSGRAVLGSVSSGKRGFNETSIDISALKNGNYVLQLVNPTGVQYKSFIISR